MGCGGVRACSVPCNRSLYITIENYVTIQDICIQWRIQGDKSGHGPPIEIGNGVWPPSGTEIKSNGSIVILLKSKDFGPPVSMSAADLAPLWTNTIYKTRKRSMTKKKKKRSSEILGDRWNFFGKCRYFSGNS